MIHIVTVLMYHFEVVLAIPAQVHWLLSEQREHTSSWRYVVASKNIATYLADCVLRPGTVASIGHQNDSGDISRARDEKLTASPAAQAKPRATR